MPIPFWHLFNELRLVQKAPLNVDDYLRFLKALHLVPDGSIDNLDQLADFCKVFWLKNSKDEVYFDRTLTALKKSYSLEFQKLFKQKEPEDNIITESSTRVSEEVRNMETSSGPGIPEKPQVSEANEIDVPETEPDIPTNKESEVIEDFELEIADIKGSRGIKRKRHQFPNYFIMDDDFVSPFEKRFLAQRLRRVTETRDRVQGDQLDIPAILDDFFKNQFISKIVYESRPYCHSNIVLLADRMGSMFGYEHVEEQLAQSLLLIPGCKFEHYYFNNLPQETNDGHYSLSIAGSEAGQITTDLCRWKRDTWVLVLSDAGAHSGGVNKGRIRSTIRFWDYLTRLTKNTYWLNPVDREYYGTSTAKRLLMLIDMYGLERHQISPILNKYT